MHFYKMKERFFQPSFRDWSLIDANLIVSGKIKLNNKKLLINIKLWDVYREKLILSKKVEVVNDNNTKSFSSYYFKFSLSTSNW